MTTALHPGPVTGVAPRPHRRVRPTGRRVGQAGAGVAVAALSAGLVAVFPGLLHTTWREVWALLVVVPTGWLPVLAVVWLAGLLAHTLVLSASLPGLSARRALALNLAGSSVANVLPLGGPLSLGLTTGMARSWGFRPTAIGAFLTVSTVWNTAVRAGLGLVGLLWWVTRPGATHPAVVGAAAAPVVVVLAVLLVVLGWDSAAALAARAAGRLAVVTARAGAVLRGRTGDRVGEVDRRDRVAGAVASVRGSSVAIARRSWPALSAGMLGYSVLLCVLLALCLRVLGVAQPVTTVVAVVCVERLLTAVPLTPGGVGIAEIGLAGSLVLAGVDPASAAAVALLYRLFTFALEIPVGLVVATGWGLARRAPRLPRAVVRALPTGGRS